VKSLIALLLSAAISLTSMQASASHVHEHESSQQHTGSLFHTHLHHIAAFAPHGPVASDFDPDDDAVFHNWLCFTAGGSAIVLAGLLYLRRSCRHLRSRRGCSIRYALIWMFRNATGEPGCDCRPMNPMGLPASKPTPRFPSVFWNVMVFTDVFRSRSLISTV
jgi:hypothetical protein